MRLYNVFIVVLFCVFIFSCEEEPRQAARYPYLTYLPPAYQQDSISTWPLIIFLHGASLRGNSLDKIKKYGIPKLIDEGQDFDFIIVSPQCPLYRDWSTDIWFPALYREVGQAYRIDTSRVYLTGLSMGGEGTWYIAEQYPEVFAAIAPVCGRSGAIERIRRDAGKITGIPTWIFHGAKDRVYSVEESDVMFKRLRDVNPDLRYYRYPDLGHGATHAAAYRDSALYRWFLEQRK